MDFHVLPYVLCLCCLCSSASLGLRLSAAALIRLTMYDFAFSTTIIFYSCSDKVIESPHRYITRKPDKRRAVTSFIIWISDVHADPASEDILSTGLDSILPDSFPFSNEFCLFTAIGSKSLERRFIGSGYDASLSSVNRGLSLSGHHSRFLILWEATVRDLSIDKYNTFHSFG